MRLLLEPVGAERELPVAVARAALAAGLDGVLLTASDTLAAPLVTAAYVAASVPDLLVAAEVALGDRHPVEVAEEMLTVDQATQGRLIAVARPADGAEEHFAEALEIVRAAATARPFAFAGERWTVPARLAENTDAHDELVRVMPPPARARLELWWAGDLARERYDGAAALVARLRAGRERAGWDWVAVAAPADAAAEIGARVRPRVQLDRLPDGLEDHWERTLESERSRQ